MLFRSSTKTNIRTHVAIKSDEKESLLQMHTSPSMPNFARSSSSILPREDVGPKLNDDTHNGMVAINIPDFIELDSPSIPTDIEQGRFDYPTNDKRTSKKNDSTSNDDDDGNLILF